ncbi:MAG: TIM barrel protein, partial [Verrucomicrobiota bacterium]
TIGNWAHSILDPFDITEAEVARCIDRMQRLDSKIVRIMTYAILENGNENDLPDQHKDERFKRTCEIKKRFDDAGITVVHENCMNYGGMSIEHAKETIEAIPGIKWVFDTGNPVFNPDRSKPRPYPRQDTWEFYELLKEHTAHVHIKDGVWNDETKEMTYTLPGDGDGDVERVLRDLKESGYDGYISIEPHTAAVFHDTDSDTDPEEKQREMFESYVTYGERMKELIEAI